MVFDKQDIFVEEFVDFLDARAWQIFATNPILGQGGIPLPDQSEPLERQLGFILLYLLDHVGLGDLTLQLEAWTLDPGGVIPEDQPYEPIDSHTSLAYLNAEDRICRIVYDPQKIDDPTRFLGAAALVVAEVYRDLNGETHPDSEEDSDRQALLTNEFEGIALGFVVLLANASLHITTHQLPPATPSAAQIQLAQARTTTQGILGPERLGYLCALQMRARKASAETIAQIRGGLLPKPRHAFEQALERIDDSTLAAFNLLKHGAWSLKPLAAHPPVDMDRLSILRGSATHNRALGRMRAQRNRKGLVFRVPTRLPAPYIITASCLGIPALALIAFFGSPCLGALFITLVAIVTALFYWESEPFHQCSHLGCETELPPDAERCPGCAGTVIGLLQNPDERLMMEEEWRNSHQNRPGVISLRKDPIFGNADFEVAEDTPPPQTPAPHDAH